MVAATSAAEAGRTITAGTAVDSPWRRRASRKSGASGRITWPCRWRASAATASAIDVWPLALAGVSVVNIGEHLQCASQKHFMRRSGADARTHYATVV